MRAAAGGRADIGIIVYNTFWTTRNLSFAMVERLAEIPNVVGLKWATPRTDAMEFEDVTSHFSKRFTIIDNNLFFAFSAMRGRAGLRGPSVQLLAGMGHQADRRGRSSATIRPSPACWWTRRCPSTSCGSRSRSEFTSGDGYLDKLCMELVGLPSSRCRPPTRDVRPRYREAARAMMRKIGAPRLLDGAGS